MAIPNGQQALIPADLFQLAAMIQDLLSSNHGNKMN